MSAAEPDASATWPTYRRLLAYIGPYRWIMAAAVVAMTFEAGTFATFTWLLETLLDEGFVAQNPAVIRWLPFAVIGLIGGRGVAAFCSQYGIAVVGRSVVRDLRSQVFRRYLTMPSMFFDRQASGGLVARLTYNIEQVAQACTTALTVLVRDSLIVIGLLCVMFYFSAALSLAVLLIGPVIALVIRIVSRRFRRYSERIQDSMGDVTQIAEELVVGHRVVKIYGGEERETASFQAANHFNRRQHLKMTATQSLSSGFVQLAAGFALAGILYAATGPLADESFSAGSFTAYMTAMLGILPSLRRLTNVQSIIQKGVAGADSVFAILDSAEQEKDGEELAADVTGTLEFDAVTLRYSDAQSDALTDVSLQVPAGKVTALVGESGSGKTSLVNLIPRFYEPSAGSVLLDGTPLTKLSLSSLRENIAFVSQDVVLFNDTVERNIAYGGLAEASKEAIIEAARNANAWEFIERLPNGLDTQVGERGALLSGGQRQRIAIARAMLKDAPILILDEATSALDSKSERLIQSALDNVMANRTTIVIAHRLSTIENADQVVVLHEGEIVERGTHDALLSAGGRYATLHKLQFERSA